MKSYGTAEPGLCVMLDMQALRELTVHNNKWQYLKDFEVHKKQWTTMRCEALSPDAVQTKVNGEL
jgi:hypothetical protein